VGRVWPSVKKAEEKLDRKQMSWLPNDQRWFRGRRAKENGRAPHMSGSSILSKSRY